MEGAKDTTKQLYQKMCSIQGKDNIAFGATPKPLEHVLRSILHILSLVIPSDTKLPPPPPTVTMLSLACSAPSPRGTLVGSFLLVLQVKSETKPEVNHYVFHTLLKYIYFQNLLESICYTSQTYYICAGYKTKRRHVRTSNCSAKRRDAIPHHDKNYKNRNDNAAEAILCSLRVLVSFFI